MKIILIILVIILNFAAISCKEQDFFADTAKPHINSFIVGHDNIKFEFISDTSKNVIIFISEKKLVPKEYNQFIKDFSPDTINWINAEKVDENYYLVYAGIDSIKKINIQNLTPSTIFYLYFFEQTGKKSVLTRIKRFVTFELEPKIQSQNITFGNSNESRITVKWQNGNGHGRVVLVRKDSMPSLPVDGKLYKASSKYGEDSSKINKNGTYCIFNSAFSKENKVVVTNMIEGKYYFIVCEYNGLGEFVNYLTDSSQNNPRNKSTSISAPVALPATIISNNSFYANWKDDPDAEYYLLDISEDFKFGKVFDMYNSLDVGDSNTVEIVLPNGFNGNQVFYRLRAFANGNFSSISNTVTVDIEKGSDKTK
jgi:hypothetical protein